MPFLDYVKPSEATGAVKEEYDQLEEIVGFVPSMTQVLSLKAETMAAHQNLFRTLFYGPSNLSRADREMVVTYVSRLNQCEYWTAMHGEFLRIEGQDYDLTDAIKAGQVPDGLDDRRRAMLRVAEKLTKDPARMTSGDYEQARTHGFTDEDIYDLVFVASFTNHMDRVADGLDAVVGDEEDRCRAIADGMRSGDA